VSDQFKYVQTNTKFLAGSGAIVGATSITLTDFYQLDGTTALTMTDFGSIGYGTLEPGNSTQEEQISFSGVTANASGTFTLTGVKNVLTVSPYTQTSGLAIAHPGGAKFVISNTAGFYDSLTGKADDETVTGLWTFPNGANTPILGSSYVAPTASTQVAPKQYVDSVVAGTANYDQNLVSGVAGEALAAGNLVYLKSADGRWWLCDADVATTISNVRLGFAQGTATAGNSVTILIGGIDKNQSGLTAGTSYFASNTAGGLSASTGTSAWIVGQALTTTQFILDPNFTYIPTPAQKAGMVGTSGLTVSASNKLVDANDASAAGASGKIVRATGTALPALSGINLVSTSIAGLFESSQLGGDLVVKNVGNGWGRLADVAAGSVLKSGGVGALPTWGTLTSNYTVGFAVNNSQNAVNDAGTAISRSLPANSMGRNGYIKGTAYISAETGTSSTTAITIGGSTVASVSTDGNTADNWLSFYIGNRGATNSQVGSVVAALSGTGVTTGQGTASVDTTQAQTVTVLVSASGGAITFEYVELEVTYRD